MKFRRIGPNESLRNALGTESRRKTTKERRVQTNVGLSPTALEAAEWMVEHQGYTSRSRLVDTLILREAKALGFVAEEYTRDE